MIRRFGSPSTFSLIILQQIIGLLHPGIGHTVLQPIILLGLFLHLVLAILRVNGLYLLDESLHQLAPKSTWF